MRFLTVPNWSFGRSKALLRRFSEILAQYPVAVHYLRSDVDHNRTVSAFSGEPAHIESALFELADEALPTIDLNRHVGVHPRIGALDVLPFVPLDPSDTEPAIAFAASFAERFAERYEVPVFLYERSETGRHESDLPSLRRGGFGALLERELTPDFGPNRCHAHLGATVVGVRDFLVALNVDLNSPYAAAAREIAAEIRIRRKDGDPTFLGVRSLGMTLPSREMSQVSMNLTLPDLTPIDPIIEWVENRGRELGVASTGAELIGVIRARHLEHATRVPFAPEQVV